MSRRKSGFSLIELLVVIGIIAILAAILFPMLTKAQARAKMMHCLSNLKQLGSAITSYRNDNNGYLPDEGYWTGMNCPNDWCGRQGNSEIHLEKGSLWPYVKNKKVYMCDADKTKEHKYAKTNGIWPLSYSMLFNLRFTNPDNAPKLKRISKCLLFVHEAADRINDGDFVPQMGDIPSGVHYDGTTAVYVDGHAVFRTTKALIKEYQDGDWNTGHE